MATNHYLNLLKNVSSLKETGFLVPALANKIPCRTTFILKRRHPVNVVKYGEEEHYRRFKKKHHIYDLVEDTGVKKLGNVKVILKTYVEGFGQEGDIVELKRNVAYNKLLVPRLADYPTEEEIKRFEENTGNNDAKQFSSKTAPLIVKFLEKMVLGIVMNKETPWTLEPWHVRVAFRKAGASVPEYAITLPKEPITGPDLTLEDKEFVIRVTVNKREVARVRSRIHHWSTNIQDRLPFVPNPRFQKHEPLFKEDVAVLAELPMPSEEKSTSQAL